MEVTDPLQQFLDFIFAIILQVLQAQFQSVFVFLDILQSAGLIA